MISSVPRQIISSVPQVKEQAREAIEELDAKWEEEYQKRSEEFTNLKAALDSRKDELRNLRMEAGVKEREVEKHIKNVQSALEEANHA